MENCKGQKNKALAVKMSFLETSNKLNHNISPIWMPKTDMNKDSTNKYYMLEGGSS